jgi:outer membrane protein TolC
MHMVRGRVRPSAGALAVLTLLLGWPRASGAQQLPPGQAESKFLGSVPTGDAVDTPLSLSLKEAFDRALKHNLGLLESDQDVRAARAVRLRGLSALLPDVSGDVSASRQQLNLATVGFSVTIPGISVPSIVGPFSVADARVTLSQQIFNWSDLKHWKSTAESERAAQYANRNDREMVVLAAGYTYLAVIADQATVDSTRAQLASARALYDRALDQNKTGVIAGIDVLRARVELQTEQQRLITAENQLSIDKLRLARVIGLPNGQQFQITDSVPYAPLEGVTPEQAIERAMTARPDYLSAKGRLRAAELERQAAAAANLPSVSADADYGDIGSPNFGKSHGTFSATVRLHVPIFPGTRVRANTLEADSALQQRKAELADLEGRIDRDVRTAVLNLQSSSDLVAVARSNIDLASQTLAQAQDRFAAGIANNLDVVQAQESVAAANQSYIASLYAHNLAKISLAQAMGVAEQSALEYLGAK